MANKSIFDTNTNEWVARNFDEYEIVDVLLAEYYAPIVNDPRYDDDVRDEVHEACERQNYDYLGCIEVDCDDDGDEELPYWLDNGTRDAMLKAKRRDGKLKPKDMPYGDIYVAVSTALDALNRLSNFGLCISDSTLKAKLDVMRSELDTWHVGMEVLAERGEQALTRDAVEKAAAELFDDMMGTLLK